MIFLTLGTNHPFDRMLEIVDRWCADNPGERVVGQIYASGAGGYRPQHFEWVTHLEPDDYQDHMKSARFVVAHAGMGSIITALCMAKPILIFPRRASLKEQRNDHQLATVERWRQMPGVYAALDERELLLGMDRLAKDPQTGPGGQVGPFASARLTDALHHAIHDHRPRRAASKRRVQDAAGVGAPLHSPPRP